MGDGLAGRIVPRSADRLLMNVPDRADYSGATSGTPDLIVAAISSHHRCAMTNFHRMLTIAMLVLCVAPGCAGKPADLIARYGLPTDASEIIVKDKRDGPAGHANASLVFVRRNGPLLLVIEEARTLQRRTQGTVL